ncbi:MAG: hypothetical protein A3K10_05025 [Bacteroidetes bacterium RIFCSPLOWO2_12_FULL_31_6]|nr:MAG: hypothetical protein A3K10_05025 [Bacteroidetes bacterium RIFCSPLOWO2_12_FULL_31_6]
MNDNLRKAEKEMFISIYGEEEFEKLEEYIESDLAKQRAKASEKMPYTKRPKSIRAEIDRENNLKQRNMEKFEYLFKEFKPENSEKDFKKIAKALMTEFAIKINETEFYLTEIEFYCKTINNDSHQDPYVHGDNLQKEFGKWYFHGSGLDITFGNENFYGGILLRGIKTHSENEWKYTSGPLNVVKELFSKTNSIGEKAVFCLEPKEEKILPLNGPFFSNRVGLKPTINKKYFDRKYRAIIDISSKHPFKEKEKVYKVLKDDTSVKENLNEIFGYKIK